MTKLPGLRCMLFGILWLLSTAFGEDINPVGLIDTSDKCFWSMTHNTSVIESYYDDMNLVEIGQGCYELQTIVSNRDTRELEAIYYDQSNLKKRANVKSCLQWMSLYSPKYLSTTWQWIGGSVLAFVSMLSANLLAASKENKCLSMAGSSAYGGLFRDGDKNRKVAYWKITTTGKNCDTTAQQLTLQGGIYKFLKDQGIVTENNDFLLPPVMCLSMTHGGTWEAHVTAGYDEDLVNSSVCVGDSSYDCVSGGKNSNPL